MGRPHPQHVTVDSLIVGTEHFPLWDFLPGTNPLQIEMENVASSIVKGAIYFDLIKGALVGPRCLIP